jgi:hypothetical protein
MISHLINSILIGVIFLDILERRFPNQFKEFVIAISYNSIYYFSKLQILIMKSKKKLNTFIESNPTLFNLKQKFDMFILQSETQKVIRYYVKNNKLCNLSDVNNVEPDFMILSWLNNNTKCVNNKITYNKDDDSISENSNIKFVLIEIKIGDTNSIKIDLKTDEFNYYLVGNKFTKDFFIFYLKHYLKLDIEIKDTDKISVKIIDHDINNIILDFTDKNESIILDKDGYNLSITNHNKG